MYVVKQSVYKLIYIYICIRSNMITTNIYHLLSDVFYIYVYIYIYKLRSTLLLFVFVHVCLH